MTDPYQSYDNNGQSNNSYSGGGGGGYQNQGQQKSQNNNGSSYSGGGGGYKGGNSYNSGGGGGGYQKKKWDGNKGGGFNKSAFVPPDLEVQHVVTIALESKLPFDECQGQLMETLKFLTQNGFTPRVTGPEEFMKMALSVNDKTITVGPWKKFGDFPKKAAPNDQIINLAKKIFPHIENMSEVAQKFSAANVTAVTGLPFGERSYALVIYTPNGSINPDDIPDSHKYLNPIMRVAQIYKVPIVNLGSRDFMEKLERETISRYNQL